MGGVGGGGVRDGGGGIEEVRGEISEYFILH